MNDDVGLHDFAPRRVEYIQVGRTGTPAEDEDQPRRLDHRVGDPGLGDEDDLGVGIEPQQGYHVDRDIDHLGRERRARRKCNRQGRA